MDWSPPRPHMDNPKNNTECFWYTVDHSQAETPENRYFPEFAKGSRMANGYGQNFVPKHGYSVPCRMLGSKDYHDGRSRGSVKALFEIPTKSYANSPVVPRRMPTVSEDSRPMPQGLFRATPVMCRQEEYPRNGKNQERLKWIILLISKTND